LHTGTGTGKQAAEKKSFTLVMLGGEKRRKEVGHW